jgi:hypothetical protein
MAKIRDLGISVIPATMRPPEIGGGGGDVRGYRLAEPCGEPSGEETIESCPDPSGCCGGKDKDKDKDKDKKEQKYFGAITAAGAAQLKDQLRQQLGNRI